MALDTHAAVPLGLEKNVHTFMEKCLINNVLKDEAKRVPLQINTIL